jgi:hypothetical protein
LGSRKYSSLEKGAAGEEVLKALLYGIDGDMGKLEQIENTNILY